MLFNEKSILTKFKKYDLFCLSTHSFLNMMIILKVQDLDIIRPCYVNPYNLCPFKHRK